MRTALGLTCAALLGCGAVDDEKGAFTAAEELSLHAVDWNAAKAEVGAVNAIAEDEEELVLFGARGATLMAGGAVRGVIAGPGAWNDAAIVPAADGIGDWTIGVTDAGAVLRVRGDVLEDVSGRWGLTGVKVRSVVGIDRASVAFGFEGGLAIADGTRVTRYPGPKSGALAGGGGKLAWIDGGVSVLGSADRKVRTFAVASATGVVVDATGRVVVAAERGLWVEHEGSLRLRWTFDAPIGAMTTAGARVWMTVGSELAVLGGDALSVSAGANVASDARLRGTHQGQVWVLATSGVRKLAGAAPSEALADWQATMQPIYARVCSSCHDPGSGADLSTLEGWRQRRDEIEQRVVIDRTMPPPSKPFSEADRDAIRRWVERTRD